MILVSGPRMALISMCFPFCLSFCRISITLFIPSGPPKTEPSRHRCLFFLALDDRNVVEGELTTAVCTLLAYKYRKGCYDNRKQTDSETNELSPEPRKRKRIRRRESDRSERKDSIRVQRDNDKIA